MGPTQFLSALLAIVVIDLVLAGDNAIVIALAARALPAHLQKRAIIWGAIGAIVVRTLMTVIVVWLLKIPGLLLAGGAMLVWIAYHLLLPDEGGTDAHGATATTFWGAMRTIVIADAVMGLDNVLAVAGAAHGSYLLVVAGLVISVPIVVWGSTLVLKVVERYPGVVYVGAGVLVWTAAKMMTSEPLIKPWFDATPMLAVLSPIVDTQGDETMLNVLVPVGGSANALRALQHAIAEYQRNHALELHLLNVQPPLSRHIARFVSRQERSAWHHDQATAAMAAAKALLDWSGVPHQSHWVIGNRADEICHAAARLGVHHIVMGTARKNSITRMLEDSTTNRVLEATPVPVEVIAGDAVSNLERYGIPTVIGIAITALLMLA